MGEPVRCTDAQESQDVLRIYDGARAAGASGELSADMRLSELVDRYYKPVHLVMHDARPRNVEEIDQTVKYWIHFTGDPPLAAIDVFTNRNFVVGLKTLPGRKYPTMGNNTIRKHCCSIQTILDLCGPPSRDNREGLGILDLVPYVPRPPKEDKEAEDCFTFGEVEQLVQNADAATLPGGLPCSAGAYMRRIYVLVFNTGIRIGGVMGATWKHYHGDHLVLQSRVAAKGRRDQRVELNEVARQVIELMQGYDAERIFPWPRSWPASRHSLYMQHDLIKTCLPARRRFAFHGVRKLTNNELARINPKACEKVLGHKLGRTNVESYTSREVSRDALAQMRRLTLSPDRQQTLFD